MKKRKLKLKKKVKVILAIILTGIIICVFESMKDNNIETPEKETTEEILNKKTYLNTFSNSSDKKLDNEYKEVIVKYIDLYFKSMINLEVNDVTNLFSNPKGAEAYLTKSALELLIEHHKLQSNDMRLTKASYNIEVTNIKEDGRKTEVEFLENDFIRFKYLNVDSELIDVKNTIILSKKDGKVTIDSLRVVQNNYVMFTNELSDINKSDIDKLKDKYIKSIKKEVKNNKILMEQANSKKYNTDINCDGKYNRDKAAEYSYKYTRKRNPDYIAYDSVGGNCQNMVSQSVHAGGIPMDSTGSYQWKHYSSEINEKNEAKGRSASWTGTQNFYEYVKNNTDKGICSDNDVNIYYAETGDVGHVGYRDYSHAVLIVDVVKDENGNVIDLLVNSNTASLENYPFMGYVYPNKRIIKILGYND